MLQISGAPFRLNFHRIYIRVTHSYIFIVSIIKTPRLTIDRLDELFIKFWTLEGAVTERGAAITIWRLKPIDQSNRFNYGCSHYNMAFYCQWPIKSSTETSVSLAFASIFFVNNSSRRSSRCPRTISLDDRDYERSCTFPRGDSYQIAKIHWRN
mgnify:CR=1 FL=1